jgi:hypothetical protein
MNLTRRDHHDVASVCQAVDAAISKRAGAAQHETQREVLVRVARKRLRPVPRSHQLDGRAQRRRKGNHVRLVRM